MNRLSAHADIAASLARLGDPDLTALVESGTPLGTGIGGRATLVEVDGHRVFVKRVPLTDLELRPDNVRSTANLFDMPPYCHYGIGAMGSPGFGAWRELAVHEWTTDWVLSGRFPGFPLLYHWRVLPDTPRHLPDELTDVERAVAYWGPRIRERAEALLTTSASLALFLEYVPHTLHDWFSARLRTDADAACALVEQGLEAVTAFLAEHRLLHFDAHFRNFLTDGRRLYLTDYGLALSPRFQLTAEESEFYELHRRYDRSYGLSYLVHWLVVDQYGLGRDERQDFIRACTDGRRPEGVPEAVAGIISRHARLATVVGDFNRRLEQESRLAPYPLPYNSSTLSA